MSAKKTKPSKVRKFKVWARCNHRDGEECVLEFSEGESDDVIEAECADALHTLIGNQFDTGWDEVAE